MNAIPEGSTHFVSIAKGCYEYFKQEFEMLNNGSVIEKWFNWGGEWFYTGKDFVSLPLGYCMHPIRLHPLKKSVGMTDFNKLRSEFESNEYIKSIIQNFEWSEKFNNYQIKDCVVNGNIFDLLEAKNDEQLLNGAWFGWQEKAKAQAVPEGYVVMPRVPTEKMYQAYERYSVAPMSTLSKTGYKAMVEASESGAEG